MGAPGGDVTELLRAWGDGDEGARDRLIPLVYQELRRRAAAYMRRERRDHTLQPTALVHEAYLRLLGGEPRDWSGRGYFFAAAATASCSGVVSFLNGCASTSTSALDTFRRHMPTRAPSTTRKCGNSLFIRMPAGVGTASTTSRSL